MINRIFKVTRCGLWLLPLLALFPAPLLHCQGLQGVFFDRLMPETLPGQTYPVIHCLIQDRRGFIWVAGPQGLGRYDGTYFLFFRHREDDPGSLSDDLVFNVFEDSRGNLWVTSDKGLNLLDRKKSRFLHFRHDPADPRSLSSDHIRAICEDKTGALWIGTKDGGVCRMDPVTRQFTRFLHDPANPDSPGSNEIWALCPARDGKVWVGATGAGLDCRDPERGSWSHYPYDGGDPAGLNDRHYWALREGRDGRIWVGSNRKGLFFLEPSTGRFVRMNLREREAEQWDYRILSLCEDRDGLLWIGTEDAGLFRLDPETGALSRTAAAPGQEGGLSHNTVLSIIEDREGLLWFGTADGISLFNKNRFRFPVIRPDPARAQESPAAGGVLSLFEDGNGILWVGTAWGGISAWKRAAGSWTRVPLAPVLSAQMMKVRVQAIAEDDRGDLWLGTSAGLYRYSRRTRTYSTYLQPASQPPGPPHGSITALRGGRPGYLWVGSREGGFFEWDIRAEKARFFSDLMAGRFLTAHINVLFVDRRGQVWAGTEGDGIIRFDPGTRRWSEYALRSGDPMSVAFNTVYAIAEDTNGGIWAGTDSGLCLFEADRDEWTRPAEDAGLSGRPVFSVVPDDQGNIWMSSEKDLIKIHLESRLKRMYGPEDGLQGGRFGTGAGIRCRDGEVVFGGAAGVNYFRPGEIRDNPYLPPVAVMSFNLSSPPATIPILDRAEELTIPMSRLPLRIRVSALSFSHPERQRFRVRMTSPEERVFELGTERILRLDVLKPGRSRFVFYASNHDQVWNPEGTALSVRVRVPFWQSRILQLALAVLAAASFWLWFRRRRRLLKKRLLHQIEGDLGPLPERYGLTKREQEVLALILQGKSNKDIETELFISGKTVKNHVYNLYQKLDVKSRLELANAVREFAAKNRPPAGP